MNNDLISRRAAIDTIRKHELVDLDEKRRWYNHGLMDAEIAILDVPCAEPEIIRCGECKNHIDERCIQADHHTSDNDCCMTVFHAERRTDEQIW